MKTALRGIPMGWEVTRSGHGRGNVMTRVQFSDGTGINFSGRLTDKAAIAAAERQLSEWDALNMRAAGLAAFGRTPEQQGAGQRAAPNRGPIT